MFGDKDVKTCSFSLIFNTKTPAKIERKAKKARF